MNAIFRRLVCRVIDAFEKSPRERYPQYKIGKRTYGDLKVLTFGADATLTVGTYCAIGKGVKVFLGGEHRTDWATTYPFTVWDAGKGIKGHPKTKGDVVIGNDVWIGVEAMIMSGVKVGDGAAIGARAVVTKDVPPYSVVAGNPARLIRNRFDEQTIRRLLALKRWDWDEKKIERYIPMLLSPDVGAFLEAAEAEAQRVPVNSQAGGTGGNESLHVGNGL